MAEETRFFTAYSFRTSSRFGSRVQVVIDDDVVTVTGVRVPRWLRDAWIGAMAGIMGLFSARVLFGRRGKVRAFTFEWIVASLGALFLWWPSERGPGGMLHGASPEFRAAGTEMATRRYQSWSFRLAEVSDVQITPFYARRGLWYVAWLWQLTEYFLPGHDSVVVFDVAVDDESPREKLVFALNLDTPEEARALAAALRGEG